jgi:hypothetical protein
MLVGKKQIEAVTAGTIRTRRRRSKAVGADELSMPNYFQVCVRHANESGYEVSEQ